MKTKSLTIYFNRWLSLAIAITAISAWNVYADYHSTVLADQPVAYYPINSSVDPVGITATDLSGNGNNGTYNGTDPEYNTVTGPSSFIPTALYFDGFTSFVDLSTGSNPSLLSFSGPITMEAWVQPSSATVGSSRPADILGKGYDGTNEMTLRANGGYYFGGTYNNDAGGRGASGGVQGTDWTYLVSTYDGTNWNLYVNSVLVQSSADANGAINFTAPWAIGDGTTTTAGDNSGSLRFFTGNITEVALYTNALTPSQVLNHFCVGEVGSSAASSVPIIITQPQPQTAVYGGSATFAVQAVSALTTTNQWYKNNVPISGATNISLTLNNVGVGDAVNYSVVVGNSNGATNSTSVSLTIVAANSLKWNAVNSSDLWDTSTTANWLNLSNSTQTAFSPFDQVLFDDTVGVSNNVTINGTVSPSLITVNSSTNNFTFAQGSSPALAGTGSLVKQGNSSLNIFAPAGFAGAVSVQGGSIYAGNNCFKNAAAITVTNSATLDLGGGTFNDDKPIILSGMGVNGKGALYNSYADQPSQLINVTLAGDTKFGSSARWDLASGSQIHGPHNLTIDFQDSGENYYGQWNSPNIGADVLGITLTNHTALGVVNMDSSFQNPGTVVTINTNCQLIFYGGGWNGSFHVNGGGQVYFWSGPAAINGTSATLEDNAQWYAWGGSGDEPVNCAMILNGVAHFLVGDNSRIYTNVFSGPGGFVMDGWNHQLIMSASNTYSGPTVIGDGPQVALTGNGAISHSSLIFFGGSNPTSTHIDVSGRADQTLTLASGQTLAGIGNVNGNLIVSSGAIVSPAGTNTTIGMTTGSNPTGAISAANAVTLNGTTTIKLNGSGVNDQIQAGGNINYGGTLNLINISGSPLAAGNSFQIFSAGGSYNGTFADIIPATPGAGLAWDLSQLNIGFINVVSASQPVIGNVYASGGSLIFSGTGGTANASYAVLTATNLAAPNWIPIATNSFDGTGAFSVTNAIFTGTPQLFYRILQLP